MFTVEQIENAHSKVKSGADFPKYIVEIKQLGVEKFETWVSDNHTNYFGENDFEAQSIPKYELLSISKEVKVDNFIQQLKAHQRGETDFYTFCKDCAENGIEKWIVRLDKMTCIYYDINGIEILVETIPTIKE